MVHIIQVALKREENLGRPKDLERVEDGILVLKILKMKEEAGTLVITE